MQKEILKIGEVDIEITFKPIKNLHLSVHPPAGRVTISSPEFYDLEKVKIYAATKWNWIKKEQFKIANQAREPERKFITQESHFLLGERYLLKVVNSKTNIVEKKPHKLLLNVVDKDNIDLKRKILYQFYRKELQLRLNSYIAQYADIIGLTIPKYGIRTMKTKWGSCDQNHDITLNYYLMQLPWNLIDYVLIHELVHTEHLNHSEEFWNRFEEALPGAKKIRKELKTYKTSVIAT